MTTPSVTELLETLHERGVQLKARGEQVLYSPRSAMTPELLSSLSDRKPELLAALGSPLAPLPMIDGCGSHAITPETVAERWADVMRRDLRPGHCACCAGPAQPWTLTCRSCEPLTEERRAELTAPRPCALCGSDGYTFGVDGWRCERCWRAAR